MGLGLIWQDWTTLQGTANTPLLQPTIAHADLTGFHDVSAHIHVVAFTGSVLTLFLETSPTADDALFTSIGSLSMFPGLTSLSCGLESGTAWGRYLRWRLLDSAPWKVTFRIFLTGYPSKRTYPACVPPPALRPAQSPAPIRTESNAQDATLREVLARASEQERAAIKYILDNSVIGDVSKLVTAGDQGPPRKDLTMSAAVLLQDWVTIKGNAAGTVVTQPVSGYADLAAYQDVVAYMEVSDVSGTLNFMFETSPTDDDNLFKNMDAAAFNPTIGMAPKIYRYASATVPLARFMRWKVNGAVGAWTLTFRVWLSPNLG